VRALHLLYEAEVKGETPRAVLAALPVAPDPYARRLAAGAGDRLADIDALVAGHASGWALDRMPAIDRQLLRLGAYELLAELDVPAAVVIDEAVELAKQYSTEDSGRYVNGVLAAIARHLGRITGEAQAASSRDGGPGVAAPADGLPARPGEGSRPADAATPRPRPRRPGTVGSVRTAPRR
jgi:N utilization substance protein B